MFDNFIERNSEYLMNAIKDLLFIKGHDYITDKFLTLINLKGNSMHPNTIITNTNVDIWFRSKGTTVLRPADPKSNSIYYHKFDNMNYAAKITVYVYMQDTAAYSIMCGDYNHNYEKVTLVKPLDYRTNTKWSSLSFFCIIGPNHKKYGNTVVREIDEYYYNKRSDTADFSKNCALYSGYNDVAEIKNLDGDIIGLCYSISIKFLPWYGKIMEAIDFDICNIEEYHKLGAQCINRTLIVGDHGTGKSKLCHSIACYYGLSIVLMQGYYYNSIDIGENDIVLLDDFDIALERNIRDLNKIVSNSEENKVLATCTDINKIPSNILNKFTNIIHIEGLNRKESEKIADFYKLPYSVLDIVNFENRIPIAVIHKYLSNIRTKNFKSDTTKEKTIDPIHDFSSFYVDPICSLQPLCNNANIFNISNCMQVTFNNIVDTTIYKGADIYG